MECVSGFLVPPSFGLTSEYICKSRILRFVSDRTYRTDIETDSASLGLTVNSFHQLNILFNQVYLKTYIGISDTTKLAG